MELTFGEQIKIILKRKNMTIRLLAEMIEHQTGKPMSRQNLTQKLNRDNFQEQDMREIAQVLGCVVQISVIDPMEATVASLQELMPPLSDETSVLPEPEDRNPGRPAMVPVAGRMQEIEAEEPEEEEPEEEEPSLAEADVLKEIEMALMESIQQELGKAEAEAEETPVQEEPEPVEESFQPEIEFGREEREPEEEYDALAWAQQKPTVWPRLIVPGDEEDSEDSAEAGSETIQRFEREPENGMEEKIASWDAAVKRRLDQPILMSAEERKARKAEKEAEENEAKAVPEMQEQGFSVIDPETGEEYETNTVMHHPEKSDMLLVYDREEHRWIEQAEIAFNHFQIRKRAMLGKDYEPPVYLD